MQELYAEEPNGVGRREFRTGRAEAQAGECHARLCELVLACVQDELRRPLPNLNDVLQRLQQQPQTQPLLDAVRDALQHRDSREWMQRLRDSVCTRTGSRFALTTIASHTVFVVAVIRVERFLVQDFMPAALVCSRRREAPLYQYVLRMWNCASDSELRSDAVYTVTALDVPNLNRQTRTVSLATTKRSRWRRKKLSSPLPPAQTPVVWKSADALH